MQFAPPFIQLVTKEFSFKYGNPSLEIISLLFVKTFGLSHLSHYMSFGTSLNNTTHKTTHALSMCLKSFTEYNKYTAKLRNFPNWRGNRDKFKKLLNENYYLKHFKTLKLKVWSEKCEIKVWNKKDSKFTAKLENALEKNSSVGQIFIPFPSFFLVQIFWNNNL